MHLSQPPTRHSLWTPYARSRDFRRGLLILALGGLLGVLFWKFANPRLTFTSDPKYDPCAPVIANETVYRPCKK